VFVILIQPPSSDRTPTGPSWPEPPAPPWDLIGLHTFLQTRTGHRSILFDARLYADWPRALENLLPMDSRQVVAVVRSRIFEWPAARHVLDTLMTQLPEALRVLCGPLPTLRPAECARWPGVDAIIAGDPEPTLRSLIENRHVPVRLSQTPGLALHGRTTTPFWWPDLQQLPAPAWDGVPWTTYTDFARGGLRALLRVSRGHSGQAADRAWGGVEEPLRFWDFDRLAAAFGKCAHLGVVETLVVDPPGIWTPDRLRAWCEALIKARNTHPWSLQQLPHLLSPEEALLLREAGCRRLEIILPSSRPEELARYGLRGDTRALNLAVQSMAQAGLEVLIRCWVGGPGEGQGERKRLLRLARALGYPPMRFQPFPLALDAPLLHEIARDPATPDLDTWFADAGSEPTPASFWGGADGRARAQALGESLNRSLCEEWGPRFRRWWMRWRSIHVIEELEQRSTELLRPTGMPDSGAP
jgi:hypothetical protein